VAAQSVDEIDSRRLLAIEHILELPRLAIERVIAVDHAQLGQDRDQ
jgi:hypothetical protein